MSFFANDANFCRQFISGSYLSSFLQNTLKTNQVEINTDNRTLRPVAKLKEPRDLFALPKELDCPQQAARWPTECQVLEDRVQHIEYNPPTPELYYTPTGKEIQPKPIGEEAGTVVFQYYPMSAVNYFSRSSVGGSRYFLPACPADRENEDDLRFESRFESGNLAKVVKITDTYYELYLRTDLYTNRHMQWYYFRVENTKRHIIYRFSLVNLSKGDSLYSMGMRPLLYSTKDAQLNAVGWRRCGDNITYFKNDPVNGEEDQAPNYTLSFNIEFPHDQDEVYLAHCYPYTYTDLQDYLNKLQNHPVKSTFTKLRLLCRSLAGNNVYYLTITAPSTGEEPKKKKAVVVTARVHPGETPASWMMKGFMDFLTGDSEQAKELREKFIFKLVPMLNPDGVIVGNNRCSLTGRDLNRQYRTVIRETYPPVWHTKLMIRRLMEECGIVMYCDLHAHSRKHNVFIYGCENKRYVEKRLQEQVFPLMLHKNAADKFSFENCKFRIQRSKEGTGRVVVWMMGVANSYTMEASFAGSTIGSRVDTHFSVADFESMGRAFCETLLDFCDEEPSKVRTQERLRLKIINRLVKEGSSADEPTNINLSDYSSDEGDTSSSSEEECAPHKDSNSNWEQDYECCQPLPVPPPSPVLPKREHQKAKQETTSPKTAKKAPMPEKTPPMPRKPLQVHKTTLDPPYAHDHLNDTLDFTTEFESGDESSSWQKGSRKFKTDSKGRKVKKRHMPPELIVTPAQVYEMQTATEASEKETKGSKQSSPEFKRKTSMTAENIPKERARSQSWHHAKCLPTQRMVDSKTGKSVNDLATEVQLKLGTTLRQRIWTGCPCNVIHSDTALSKDSSLNYAHWSKGPLTWTSSFSSQMNSDALLKSCSQKLSALQKNGGASKSEEELAKPKKKKSWLKKKVSKSNKITGDQPDVESDWADMSNKKSARKKLTKLKTKHNVSPVKSDPTTQVSMIKPTDSRRSSKTYYKENIDSEESSKISTKLSQASRSKFRKSGIVATAVAQYRSDSDDSDSDADPPEKTIIKKKKKRKFSLTKKPKRVQSAKVVPQSPKKSRDKDK